jgi:uncharacterized cupin superfamily protein
MRTIDQRVVNLDALKPEPWAEGDKFASSSVRIGPLVGARGLGYSYDIVAPGKTGCPFHSHRAEEEMFFIVRGQGTLRYGDETREVRAGDVICCPVGGPDTAHQLLNTSDQDLVYLSISTKSEVEVCEYPDSGKVAAFAAGQLRHITRAADTRDYWDGEL